MIGKIKTLGLAFVAISALSAVAASAAQAGALDVGTAGQNVVITGHSDPKAGGGFQEHLFTIIQGANKASAKCNTASFEGTLAGGQDITEATITATYGQGKGPTVDDPLEAQGCTFLGLKAQVLMNGCKYTGTGAGEAAFTAKVDIVGCTAGKKIEIKATGCTLTIGEQNGLSHVVGIQLTAQEVTASATVGSVAGGTIQTTQDGAACPTNGLQAANAEAQGNTIVKAFQDNGTAQVEKHKHTYNEHKCGAQINLQVT